MPEPMKPEEVPAELVQPVAEQMLRRYDSEYGADHLTWRDFADDARSDLAAVLPEHERQVRAKVAAEIEAQKAGCKEHPMPLPRPSCWTCGRDGAFHRAARIARGDQ